MIEVSEIKRSFRNSEITEGDRNMKPELEALKKRFQEEKNKGNDSKTFGEFYPFWKMQDDEEAHVRIIPFKGQGKADFPFKDRLEHIISINGEDEKIPCLKMYGEECPICAVSQKYYKAKDEEKGKYYWRKKTSLVGVYIRKDPLPADEESGETYKGKIKVTQFANQLKTKFDTQLELLLNNEDIEALPWDIKNGYDFIIRKTPNGKYAKYDIASDFARKQSSLPDDIIEDFEPIDLDKFIPENPGLEKVQRKLEAHFSGEEYVDEDDDSSESNDAVKDKLSKLANKNTSKDDSEDKVDDTETESEEAEEEVNEAEEAEEAEEDSDESGDPDEDDFMKEILRRRKNNSKK